MVVISSWQAAVIIYYSEDTYNITGTVMANISVRNTPKEGQLSDYCVFSAIHNRVPLTSLFLFVHFDFLVDLSFVIYQLNNVATNPYAEWQNQGRPKTPTPQNFMQMREKEVN